MTTETKTFINLAELQGFRYECTQCKTRFNASFADKEARQFAMHLANKIACPVCMANWFKSSEDTRSITIRQFLGYLLEARDHESNFENTGVGVKITLEMTPKE